MIIRFLTYFSTFFILFISLLAESPIPKANNKLQPSYRTAVEQLQSNLSSSAAHHESVVLCADGKGPLLEGEERIFPCVGQCPAGFECEFVHAPGKGGICCPNLSELYRLYNKEISGEETGSSSDEEGQEAQKERNTKDEPEQSDSGVNAMALLEQHYGDAIARPRTRAQKIQRSTPLEPAHASALVRSRPVEIRRSQQRWQAPTEANIWRPRAQASARATLRGQKDASGEEYSCRRQRLELFCEDGRRRTQFVMRWYAKEGSCLAYPWGYCPGEPVASDRTLRTREECELLCTDPLDAGQDASVLSVVRFGIGDSEVPAGEKPSKELQKLGQQQQQSVVDKGRDEERESPVAASVPIQEVLGQETVLAEAEPGPEPIDLSASQQGLAATGNAGGQPPAPASSSSAELAEFLLADQRPEPRRKRCEKVTPYRAMCPQDGMPSQFTLRWYQRGQSCFAYPYGYCHGESVFAEEPIKTERECLAICVQQRGNVPPNPKHKNNSSRRRSWRQ